MKIKKSQRSLHLPEEIIEEILSRLDAQSLLRFRCVSKSYRSLIDSKRFIRTHLQKAKEDTTLAHHRILLVSDADSPQAKVWECSLLSVFDNSYNNVISELNFPTNIPSYSSISLVGSCNGLVCIMLEINEHTTQFVLWNPSTRISKKLPDIGNMIWWSNLMFSGFGWDESTDDYKVIVSVRFNDNSSTCKIYSTKTDSWKKINGCDISRCWYENIRIGVLASGKLHWERGECIASRPYDKWEIVAFDLKNEVFEIVEQPACYAKGRLTPCLGTFGECLAVLCHYEVDGDEQIWVMKEYGVKESWEIVMVLPGVSDTCGIWTSPSASAFHRGEKGEMILMNLEYETKHLVYIVKSKGFHFPVISQEFWSTGRSDFYIESLVSPLL